MEARDGEAYLAIYPKLAARWINQCVLCQRNGYKPELPAALPETLPVAAANLQMYFSLLALDEHGRSIAEIVGLLDTALKTAA
jgi:hypothetical protein